MSTASLESKHTTEQKNMTKPKNLSDMIESGSLVGKAIEANNAAGDLAVSVEDPVKVANQRLLDEAWAHIQKTRMASMNGGYCSYAGVGCAFSPALKDPAAFEHKFGVNKSALTVIDEHSEYLEDWAVDIDPDFADNVQNCHDENRDKPYGDEFVNAVGADMKALAIEKGMNWSDA